MPAPAEIDFRVAGADDAHCLSALGRQVFLDTYATAGIRLGVAREAEALFSVAATLARLNEGGRRTLLAERTGHLIGFAELALAPSHALVGADPAAELGRLYVQSPFLRQGVGGSLLRRAEAIALAEGATTLWLTAWIGNQRALAFYASQGYVPLGSADYAFEGEHFENRVFAKTLRTEG
jgi:GNAT superfamily N-acetyltransferase